MSSQRTSRSEERFCCELIEIARSAAEEAGVEGEFQNRFASLLMENEGDMRRVANAQMLSSLSEMLKDWGVIKGAKYAIPALLLALIGSGVAIDRAGRAGKRIFDPDAGTPWFLQGKDNPLQDPSWREPTGSRIRQMPPYWDVPNQKTSPEFDRARRIEQEYMRDRLRIPYDYYGTSGVSSDEMGGQLRHRPVDDDEVAPGFSSLDEVENGRLRPSASARKGKFVKAQFTTENFKTPINAPTNNPFLTFAVPTSPEQAAAVSAGEGWYNPVDMRYPRYLPDGGQGYGRGRALMWEAGGSPFQTALNKMRAFSDPSFAIPAITAGLTDFYANLMLKARGGVISQETALAAIQQRPLNMIAEGIPAEYVWMAHDEALSRLEQGRGGYLPRMTGSVSDFEGVQPEFNEDVESNPWRKQMIERLEDQEQPMRDVAGPMGRSIENILPPQ